jgi:trimethylamine:corrinoid methyltransferase-like protein
MNKTHTIDRMRSTALLSEIANRLPRQQWERNGAPDPQNIAMQRVREILTGDNPAVFSPNVDDSIRAEFEGLVAGDAIPVESRVKSI